MKNALIIGDYSSLGINLKNGLEKNGVKTTVISSGDGWKDIKYRDKKDIKIKLGRIKILKKEISKTSKIKYILTYLFKVKKILKYKYDYICILNQSFVSKTIIPSKSNYELYLPITFLKKCLNKKGKIYMLACGDDSIYFKAQSKYKYFPYLKKEISNSVFMKGNSEEVYLKILKEIDGIIPNCWDYAEAYRLFYKNKDKIKKTIQFPIDLSDIEYKPNLIKDKIVIFHGLNREGFKGTEYIKEAMENIKRKYPDKVEVIIDGKMPLEEYKKVLEKTNIVIDQCKSYSYAMNALISMAQGKLVFSGNELECSKELRRDDIPVVNILPEVKDIEKKLEYYVNNPQLIAEMGEKSRKFVEEFHECSIVAKKYIEIFEEKGD